MRLCVMSAGMVCYSLSIITLGLCLKMGESARLVALLSFNGGLESTIDVNLSVSGGVYDKLGKYLKGTKFGM